MRTLDVGGGRHSIRRMNSETWLDKAARLQRSLAGPDEWRNPDDEIAARNRIKIALWLRREFDEQPPTGSNVVAFELTD